MLKVYLFWFDWALKLIVSFVTHRFLLYIYFKNKKEVRMCKYQLNLFVVQHIPESYTLPSATRQGSILPKICHCRLQTLPSAT
jgi:hypothetical protein